jgi:hypothetical protein
VEALQSRIPSASRETLRSCLPGMAGSRLSRSRVLVHYVVGEILLWHMSPKPVSGHLPICANSEVIDHCLAVAIITDKIGASVCSSKKRSS